MTMLASVELKDLVIKADIGTYAQGDIVPNEHRLDLRVWIDPSLVLIDIDEMKYVVLKLVNICKTSDDFRLSSPALFLVAFICNRFLSTYLIN